MKNTRSTKEVVVIFFFWMVCITLVVTVGMKVAGLNFSTGNETRPGASSPAQSFNKDVARFQEILPSNPENLQALIGLGDLYFDNNHYQQAIEIFIRAEKISPASVHIENDLGLLYLNINNQDKAIEKFQKVLEIDATHLVSLYYVGVAYYYKGEKDKALQIYEQVLASNPTPDLVRTVQQEIAKIQPDAAFK